MSDDDFLSNHRGLPRALGLGIHAHHRNIYRIPADEYRMTVDLGHMEAVTRFPDTSNLFIEEPTITPDGHYLVYSRSHGGSSIWLLRLDLPNSTQPSPRFTLLTRTAPPSQKAS